MRTKEQVLQTQPKYEVGELVKVCNWSGENNLVIQDIQATFHIRSGDYCWGYKFNEPTGLTMRYVPEGYLRKIDSEK